MTDPSTGGGFPPGGQAAPLQFDPDTELAELISHHHSWKRFSAFASLGGSALNVITAATAPVVAGLGMSAAAAIIATLAIIFASLEKILQFRERWNLHQAMEDQLEQMRWEFAANNMSIAELTERVNEARSNYSERMSALRVRG